MKQLSKSQQTRNRFSGALQNFDGLSTEMILQIKHKAHNLIGTAGFTKSDRDDIESELALHLWRSLPKYDPARSKLATFVSRVLNSKIANMIEARKSWYFDFRDHAFSIDEEFHDASGCAYRPGDSIEDDEYHMSYGTRSMPLLHLVEFREAVADVVERLPSPLKDTCLLILKFGSVQEVSRQTGIPRTTLLYHFKKLKRIFKKAGF